MIQAVFRLATALRRRVSGSAAVEFALVAPVLILLIMGIIAFGWVFWTQNSFQFAVEQASRCAAINTTAGGTPDCSTVSLTQSYAASKIYGLTVTASDFTVTGFSTSEVCVAFSKPFSFFALGTLVPAFVHGRSFSSTITLTGKSCRPKATT